MRLRRILVAHSTDIISNMLKHYLMSEFSDVVVVETQTTENAIYHLESQKFEIVVAEDVFYSAKNNFLDSVKIQTGNIEIPLVAVTGPGSEELISEIRSRGVEYVLTVPFEAVELKELISDICNPRSWRVNERFYIPDAQVIIHAGNRDVSADMVNISRGGVLCESSYDLKEFNVLKKHEVTIKISNPDYGFKIKHLSCKLSKLTVSRWHLDDVPDRMRLTFLFSGLSEQKKDFLEQAFQLAKDQIKDV